MNYFWVYGIFLDVTFWKRCKNFSQCRVPLFCIVRLSCIDSKYTPDPPRLQVSYLSFLIRDLPPEFTRPSPLRLSHMVFEASKIQIT